jgi:YggT family protein
LVLRIYSFILFARLILSWFPYPPQALRPVFRILYDLTEPALRLVRPLIPPIRTGAMALDLSPILIFIALQLVGGALC